MKRRSFVNRLLGVFGLAVVSKLPDDFWDDRAWREERQRRIGWTPPDKHQRFEQGFRMYAELAREQSPPELGWLDAKKFPPFNYRQK